MNQLCIGRGHHPATLSLCASSNIYPGEGKSEKGWVGEGVKIFTGGIRRVVRSWKDSQRPVIRYSNVCIDTGADKSSYPTDGIQMLRKLTSYRRASERGNITARYGEREVCEITTPAKPRGKGRGTGGRGTDAPYKKTQKNKPSAQAHCLTHAILSFLMVSCINKKNRPVVALHPVDGCEGRNVTLSRVELVKPIRIHTPTRGKTFFIMYSAVTLETPNYQDHGRASPPDLVRAPFLSNKS
uniref:Uncharacterized protein n=1 Tax=Timema bartmani TaxID=61472 RepID=A0A7R9F3T5_9NEOP|nr:unnamed protein product [Timema bartmani]